MLIGYLVFIESIDLYVDIVGEIKLVVTREKISICRCLALCFKSDYLIRYLVSSV